MAIYRRSLSGLGDNGENHDPSVGTVWAAPVSQSVALSPTGAQAAADPYNPNYDPSVGTVLGVNAEILAKAEADAPGMMAQAPVFEAAWIAHDPAYVPYWKRYGDWPVGNSAAQLQWFKRANIGGMLEVIRQDMLDSESGWEGFFDNTFPMLATSMFFGGAIGGWAAATGAQPYGLVSAGQSLFDQASAGLTEFFSPTADASVIETVGAEVFDPTITTGDYPYSALDQDFSIPESETILEGGVGPYVDIPAGSSESLNVPWSVPESETILEGGVGPVVQGPEYFSGDVPIVQTGGAEEPVARVTVTAPRPDEIVWTADGFMPTYVDGAGNVIDAGTGQIVKTVAAVAPPIIRAIWPTLPPAARPGGANVVTGGGFETVDAGIPENLPPAQTPSIIPWGLLIAAAIALTGN